MNHTPSEKCSLTDSANASARRVLPTPLARSESPAALRVGPASSRALRGLDRGRPGCFVVAAGCVARQAEHPDPGVHPVSRWRTVTGTGCRHSPQDGSFVGRRSSAVISRSRVPRCGRLTPRSRSWTARVLMPARSASGRLGQVGRESIPAKPCAEGPLAVCVLHADLTSSGGCELPPTANSSVVRPLAPCPERQSCAHRCTTVSLKRRPKFARPMRHPAQSAHIPPPKESHRDGSELRSSRDWAPRKPERSRT